MPFGFGPSGTFTSSAAGDIGGGRQYTRLRGPVLVGTVSKDDLAGASVGASVTPPHMVNVSTVRGDMLVSVISSFTQAIVGASSAYSVSTGSPTGLVYITQTTGAGNIIAAASTANAPVGLPGGVHGVALLWDAAAKTLAIFDPASATWMWPHQLGSSGNGASITWSASSS